MKSAASRVIIEDGDGEELGPNRPDGLPLSAFLTSIAELASDFVRGHEPLEYFV